MKKRKTPLWIKIVAVLLAAVMFCTPCYAAELDDSYRAHVFNCAAEMEIDPYIVLSLIENESGNFPGVVNSAGNCFGLCQIHKCWEKKAAAQGINIYDPYGNIAWCTIMLHDIYVQYGDWNKTLVVYNAGRLYANSSKYSRKIIARATELKEAYDDEIFYDSRVLLESEEQ